MRLAIVIAAQIMMMMMLLPEIRRASAYASGVGSLDFNDDNFNHELYDVADVHDVGVMRREIKKPASKSPSTSSKMIGTKKNSTSGTKKFEKLQDVMEARQSNLLIDAFVTLYTGRDWQGEEREIFLEKGQCFPLFTKWAGGVGSIKIPAGVCVKLHQNEACSEKRFWVSIWGTLRLDLEKNTAKGLCWAGVHSLQMC